MAARLFAGTVRREAGIAPNTAVRGDGTSLDRRSWIRPGMKTGMFDDGTAGRQGLWSLEDSAGIQANERKFASVRSSTVFKPLKDDGGEYAPGTIIRWAGRYHKVRPGGVIVLTNTAKAREEAKLAEEAASAVEEVMELCLASDASCQDILGINRETYEGLFGPYKSGSRFKTGTTARAIADNLGDLPEDVTGADARIRRLQLLPRSSEACVAGLAKLRVLIQELMPVLDDSGPTHKSVMKATEDPDE